MPLPEAEILQVHLFALSFGLVLQKARGMGTVLFDLIERVSHGLFEIVAIVMKFAPISAFGAIKPIPLANMALVRLPRLGSG